MKRKKLLVISLIIGLVMGIIATLVVGASKIELKRLATQDPELIRAKTYGELEESDEQTNSEYVRFSAFFLKDLNQDGNAEKVKGTCKEVGGEDILYMSLNVITEGFLKNGKIEIEADNMYFQTALVDDEAIKGNYVSPNTSVIDLKDIRVGTQKLIFGNVRSGDYSNKYAKTDAIGNDTTKYSGINRIKFTGTHVKFDGTETPIEKIVEVPVDWYDKTVTQIPYKYDGGKKDNQTQNYDLTNMINEEKQELNLTFNVVAQETRYKLILAKSYIEGEIPKLNGFSPIRVEITGSDITYEYDASTRKFTAQRCATLNRDGTVRTQAYGETYGTDRYNVYKFKVTYPLEAYTSVGLNTVSISVPVKAYYEGYNNPNEEFSNPIRSNIAEAIITSIYEIGGGDVLSIDVKVGKYVMRPYDAWVVSKEKPEKIYEAKRSNEEITTSDDTYEVKWYVKRGADGIINNLKLKETEENYTDKILTTDNTYLPMEDFLANKGIYFNGTDAALESNGYINVINDVTGELIHSFTKEELLRYNAENPYEYDMPVKHIRIETSLLKPNTQIVVSNIKEIDDETLTNLYTEEEFEKMSVIYSYLTAYVKNTGETEYRVVKNDLERANYDSIKSIVQITEVSPEVFSTQETKKNAFLTITAKKLEYNTSDWLNGEFLLKFPNNLLDVKINNVITSNTKVKIEGYSLEKREDENYYLKIVTQNDEPQEYSITVDFDMTPNPKVLTSNENFELFAINPLCENYRGSAKDEYDLDEDANTGEIVGKSTKQVQLVGPTSLITIETASEYNENHDTLETRISPQVAIIDKSQEEKTAKISDSILNNYSGNISGIKIVGKIPFENNKFQLNGELLGSTYTAEMTGAIVIPEDIRDFTTVYYSENEIVNDNLLDATNNWIKETEITDYSRVKSYLIDLGRYVMRKGEEQICTYEIKLPRDLNYNEIAYSTHAAYFYLETSEGKLFDKTETNKLGFMIARKYNLQLEKTKENTDILLKGARYQVTDGLTGESFIASTNSEGILEFKDLYVERNYTLKEIKAPFGYEKSDEEIKFYAEVDENGKLELHITQGNIKGMIEVTGETTQATRKIFVEDVPNYTLKLKKSEQGTENVVTNAIYELTKIGEEKSTQIKTNRDGIATIDNLVLDAKYKLKEVKAKGYYIDETEIEFKVIRENADCRIEFTSGNIKDYHIINNNDSSKTPEITIEVEDEKIPTYDLVINKYAKDSDSKLKDAIFKITGPGIEGEEKLTTDENGITRIEGLYEYVEGKNVDGIYTIKETVPPQGYMLNANEIKIRAKRDNNQELNLEIVSGEIRQINDANDIQVDGTTISICLENEPLFKLIKVDGTTREPLQNTKFTIEEIIDEEGHTKPAENVSGQIVGEAITIEGKEYRVVSTNENGQISVELKTGIYKVIELEAVKGYVLPEDLSQRTYYFGIGKSQDETFKLVGNEKFNQNEAPWYEEFRRIDLEDGGHIGQVFFYAGGTIKKEKVANGEEINVPILHNESTGFIKYNSDNLIEWVTYIDTYDGKSFYNRGTPENIYMTEDNKIMYISPNVLNYAVLIDKKFMKNNETFYKERVFAFIIKLDPIDGKIEYCKTLNLRLTHVDEIINKDDIIVVGKAISDETLNISENETVSGSPINLEIMENDIVIYKVNYEGKYIWIENIRDLDIQEGSLFKNADGLYELRCEILRNLTIPGEKTSNGEDILINKDELGADIKLIIDSNGKVVNAKKSFPFEPHSSISVGDNTYIYGDLPYDGYTFDSTKTVSGEEIICNYDYPSVLIKCNRDGKVEWVNNLIGWPTAKEIMIEKNGNIILFLDEYIYVIKPNGEIVDQKVLGATLAQTSLANYEDGYEATFYNRIWGDETNDIIISSEETADGSEYIIPAFNGTMTIKFNNDHKIVEVRKTEEIFYPFFEYKDYIYDENGKVALVAYKGEIIIPKEKTSNNTDIILRSKKENIALVIMKFDKNDKIEWVQPLETYCSSAKIQKTNDSYYTLLMSKLNRICIIPAEDTVNNEKITLKVNKNYFIKINEDGKFVSAKEIYMASLALNQIVDMREDGMIYAGSYYYSGKNISGEYTASGENIIISEAEYQDNICLTKYNSNGLIEWISKIGNSSSEELAEMYKANDGYIVVFDIKGDLEIPATDSFDENSIIIEGSGEKTYSVMAKYNAEGKVVWVKTIKGTEDVSAKEMGCILSTGEFLTVVSNSGEITIPSNQTSEQNGDVIIPQSYTVVIKYDQDGNFVKTLNISPNKLFATLDEGFVNSSFGVKIAPENTVSGEGMYEDGSSYYLVKYNNDGLAEFYYKLEDFKNLTKVIEKDGKYRVIGDTTLSGAKILDIEKETLVPTIAPKAEITVENEKQQLKITTDVIEHKETNQGGDTVLVKGGSITGEDEQPYETVVYGENSIKEIKVIPDPGYEIVNIKINDKLIKEDEYITNDDGSVTIKNFENMTENKHIVVQFSQNVSEIIVHHYEATRNENGELIYTENKVAENENSRGEIGDRYITAPKMDLEKYTLIVDENDNYIIPDNASGEYEDTVKHIYYYYEEKEVKLTVYHYIEGTETPVPLKDGTDAPIETQTGKSGEDYTTEELKENLNEKYMLVETPSNAEGTFEEDDVVVYYYYAPRPLGELIVHHYIINQEGIKTEERVPLKGGEEGEKVPDEITLAEEYDQEYETKVSDKIPDNFEYVERTDNWKGTIKNDVIEVIYYYKYKISEIPKQQIEKDSTLEIIKDVTKPVPYTIEYNATIRKYEGDVQIIIIDQLEFKIDEELSELDGGTYDEEAKTITWKEIVKNVNANEEDVEFTRTKNISLKYVDIDETVANVHNEATGTIKLTTPELSETVRSEKDIPKEVPKFSYTVNYYDIDSLNEETGEYTKIAESKTKDSLYGAKITVESEIIDKIDDYYYNKAEVNGEDKNSLIIGKDETKNVINLYYRKSLKSASVVEKHIDDITGEVIYRKLHEGNVGDPYDIKSKPQEDDTEEVKKLFEGYELVKEKLPKNSTGTMKETLEEVIYYYRKPATVIVKYIDKETGKEIQNDDGSSSKEEIKGKKYNNGKIYVGEEYETEIKKFDGYELEQVPENASGTVDKELVEVIYYYSKVKEPENNTEKPTPTPTPTPNPPKETEEKPAPQVDKGIAKGELPNTGSDNIILMFIGIALVIAIAACVKYRRVKA